MSAIDHIPVIDFSPFRYGSKDEASHTANQVLQAFQDVGFVYLKNHGVSQKVIDEAFSWVGLHI